MSAVRPQLQPMLASTGAIAAPASAWAFEPKLDAWRVLVYIGDALEVRTRGGHNMAVAVPELESLVDALGERQAVLDGELVARHGRPWDFYRLGPRLAARRPEAVARQRARTAVTFAIFDVLELDGESLIRQPYAERRHQLKALGLTGPAWCTVSSFIGLGRELIVACAELGLEGLVAKRLDSCYRPGERSKDWVTVKCPDWRATHAPRRLDGVQRRPRGVLSDPSAISAAVSGDQCIRSFDRVGSIGRC
jgi:bifunctional non-homologous end joining protein LigD